MSKLLKKLTEKEHLSNAWVTIPSAWTAELLAATGLDCLCIDAQHGLATDLDTILPMLQATRYSSTAVLVRMPKIDAAFSMRMLDAGVDALIAPMVKTAKETQEFVDSCYYPPMGNRSYGPLRVAKMYSTYFQEAEDLVCPMIMIETAEAVENIEEIVQVKGLKGLYVGPWDLSLSMGLDNMGDFSNAKLMQAIEKVLAAAKQANLFVGLHCASAEEGKKMAIYGFKLLTIFNDSRALSTAAKEAHGLFSSVH